MDKTAFCPLTAVPGQAKKAKTKLPDFSDSLVARTGIEPMIPP